MNESAKTLYLAEQYDSATGEVYSDRIKIGITSKDIVNRMRELSATKSPIKARCVKAWIVDDARSVESYLHTVCAEYRIEGEWFSNRTQTERIVEGYMAMHGQPIQIIDQNRKKERREKLIVQSNDTKQKMSQESLELVKRHPYVTTFSLQPANLCVSGRIKDNSSFRINPRVRPQKHYLMHLRCVGSDTSKWSTRYAETLGGEATPANKGHMACVTIKANTLRDVEEKLDKLADL